MKIYPNDMDELFKRFNITSSEPHKHEERDMALAQLLIKIYDRGYSKGYLDAQRNKDDDP